MNEKRISLDPEFTDEEYLAMMVGTEDELYEEAIEEMEEELCEPNLLEDMEKSIS